MRLVGVSTVCSVLCGAICRATPEGQELARVRDDRQPGWLKVRPLIKGTEFRRAS
jgi:hypothetical protein